MITQNGLTQILPSSRSTDVIYPNSIESFGYDQFLLNTNQISEVSSGFTSLDESISGAAMGSESGQEIPLPGYFSLGDGINAPGVLKLAIAPNQGDTYIAAGKTDFTNTENGFIIGIDDSDSDKVKVYLGNSSNYLNWNGSSLTISGNLSAGTIDIGGADATSFHVDVDGNMWLGASTFASATFKVSNAGAVTATSGTIGGSTLASSSITVGDAKIKLDATNKRTIINDGTDDRVLIGYQSGGF